MKLYDIPTEIRALLDTATVDEETGEISFDEEAYERVTGDAKVKIANTARFLREEDAEIAAMKQVLANIKSRLDAKKRRYEYLQDLCLRAVMEVGKSKSLTSEYRHADTRRSSSKTPTAFRPNSW